MNLYASVPIDQNIRNKELANSFVSSWFRVKNKKFRIMVVILNRNENSTRKFLQHRNFERTQILCRRDNDTNYRDGNHRHRVTQAEIRETGKKAKFRF